MTSPTAFQARTARFDLPLLFSGQSQKEFTVNEALYRVASLLHPVIEERRSVPPSSPEEGKSWLVDAGASGAWEGRAGALASWSGGDWVFVQPVDGLRCYDRSSGTTLFHDGEWQVPSMPELPTGGSTQDSEARAAIAGLVEALRNAGIA